jgi:hypothetical protein
MRGLILPITIATETGTTITEVATVIKGFISNIIAKDLYVDMRMASAGGGKRGPKL